MADEPETRSVKTTLAFTPTEMRALEYVVAVHGTKYSGIGEVLRDYTVTGAVELHQRALVLAAAS
jgi:hypothetical protein